MRITHLASIACGVLFGLLTTVARGDMITDNDKTLTIDCKTSPEVLLKGNHLTITLTNGACSKLNITGNQETVTGSVWGVVVLGNDNTVKLEAVDEIEVAGNNNKVSWKQPISAKKVTTKNTGMKNKIAKTQ